MREFTGGENARRLFALGIDAMPGNGTLPGICYLIEAEFDHVPLCQQMNLFGMVCAQIDQAWMPD